MAIPIPRSTAGHPTERAPDADSTQTAHGRNTVRRAKLHPVNGIWICHLIHNPRVNLAIGPVPSIPVQDAYAITLAWLRY